MAAHRAGSAVAAFLTIVSASLGAGEPQDDSQTAPRSALTEQIVLRSVASAGTVRRYAVSWQLDLQVPLTGLRHVEGGAEVEVTTESVDGLGRPAMVVRFENVRNTMEGRPIPFPVPKEGVRMVADQLREVLELPGAEALPPGAVMVAQAMYIVRFPDRRLRLGAQWSHPMPPLGKQDGPREGQAARPGEGSAVERVHPIDDREPVPWRAKHTLVALTDREGDRIATVVSHIPVHFRVTGVLFGAAGSASATLVSEYFESTGELRWGMATGRGSVRTLGAISVPLRNVRITAALVDPETGAPAEPATDYDQALQAAEAAQPETLDSGESGQADADGFPADHPLARGRR